MQKKEFKIDNNLYPEIYIQQAIGDFSDFKISYRKGLVIISGDNTEEIENIFNEFMNYVLGIYNESI